MQIIFWKTVLDWQQRKLWDFFQLEWKKKLFSWLWVHRKPTVEKVTAQGIPSFDVVLLEYNEIIWGWILAGFFSITLSTENLSIVEKKFKGFFWNSNFIDLVLRCLLFWISNRLSRWIKICGKSKGQLSIPIPLLRV